MKFSRRIDRFFKVLHQTIKTHNFEKVCEILIKNAKLMNQPDDNKDKLKYEINFLLSQTKNCHEKINCLLEHYLKCIEKGATYYLQSYFELAVCEGDVKVADVLLKNGAKIGSLYQQLPHIILSGSNPNTWKNMLHLLIKYGLDNEVKKLCGEILLRHITFYSTKHDKDVIEVLDLLINSGLSVDDIQDGGSTLLIYAVQNQNIALTSMAIKTGADTNKIDDWGQLPLHAAVVNCNMDIAKLILANGANINSLNREGKTALHIACYYNYEEMIHFLIKKGANISAEDNYCETPYYQLNHRKPNYDNCRNIMIREFATLPLENRSIIKKDLDLVKENPEVQEYFDQCYAEIRQMTKTKFYGNHSYYSVLKLYRNKISRLSRFTKNEKFVVQFKKNLTFFHYKNDLINIFDEAIQARIFLPIIYSRLNAIFGRFLPDLVIKEILENLTIEDLPLK